MKVLVTGGSGFVGGRLVRRLVAEGLAVRATHRRTDLSPVAGVEWWPLMALNDERRLAESVAGCDAIVHLAGLAHQSGGAADRTLEYRDTNIEGTRQLARAAAHAGARKFVFLSSIAAICTRSDAPVDDRTPCAPTDVYGCSKLEAEKALVAEFKDRPTDWCILRPPLVYGPGNPGNMRRLMRLIHTGLPLPFASIHNRRSFMFVDNLADAILSVLWRDGATRGTYVLCDGSDFSTPELTTALAAAAGCRIRLLRLPVATLAALGRAGDIVHALIGRSIGVDSTAIDRLVGSLPVDGSRFRMDFNWNPPVGIDQALQQMGRALIESRQSLQN